jgi:peptide/nickel transport system permease protein
MRAYTIRRLLLTIPTLLLVSIAVFMTVRFIPGSVIDIMLAENAQNGSYGDIGVTKAYLEHALGLDQPIYYQYFRWLGLAKQDDGRFHGILQGDLGHSLWG